MVNRILVTGGMGFLGQHLIHLLIKEYEDIEILVLDLVENELLFPDDFKHKYVKIKSGVDITDINYIDYYFREVDTVFHLAAIMRYGRRNRKILDNINVLGTSNILEVCKRNKIKNLIHVGSIGTIGYYNTKDKLANETFEIDWKKEKRSYYGHSKKKAIDELLEYDGNELRIVIIHPGIMIGAGDLKTQPLYKMVKRLPILISPRGGTNYIDVRDVARGLIAANNFGEHKEQYLITSNNITHKQLLKHIAANYKKNIHVIEIPSIIGSLIKPLIFGLEFIMPKKSLISLEGTSKSFHLRYYDNSKANEKLNYQPIYELNDSIAESTKWLIEIGKL